MYLIDSTRTIKNAAKMQDRRILYATFAVRRSD